MIALVVIMAALADTASRRPDLAQLAASPAAGGAVRVPGRAESAVRVAIAAHIGMISVAAVLLAVAA